MRIHFIGSLGASMSVLAAIQQSRGHIITGSDIKTGGHDGKNVEGADLVVYTSAVAPDNPEIVRAKELNIPLIERAELLGQVASDYQNVIAVSGCHGKSTTTSMMGAVFKHLEPTVHVGASGSVIGGNKYFITEACEYHRSFLHIKPGVAIVLNIELDHLDYYKDESDLFGAYNEFCRNADTVVVNGDDPLCRKLGGKRVIKAGLGINNDYRATCVENVNGRRAFCVRRGNRRLGRISLKVEGRHNIYNALICAAVSDIMGMDFEHIKSSLSAFTGTDRRFQHIGKKNGLEVISDYAHHPSEIAAGLKTARELYKGQTLTVVFQPHTFSRTKALANDFVKSLSNADRVILAPVYAAREQPIEGVSSHALTRLLIEKGVKAHCFDTFFEIVNFCSGLDSGALIFMGAGDIDAACKQFMERGSTEQDCPCGNN